MTKMVSRCITVLLGLILINAVAAEEIFGQYWPAYGKQKPTSLDWSVTDIGYYFGECAAGSADVPLPKLQHAGRVHHSTMVRRSDDSLVVLVNGLGLMLTNLLCRFLPTVTVTNNTGFTVPKGQPEADIKAFVATAHKHRKKAVFAIGGWTGSRYFSDRVATAFNRADFATSILSFVKTYGFDGVDLDWEYPGKQGIGCNKVRPTDSANFLSFLKTLRRALPSPYLITAAIGTSGIIGPNGAPLPDMRPYSKILDYINLMTYDIGGNWSPTSGPNSPFRTCNSATSVIQVVQTFKKAGVPVEKMVVGIPSYGHSYELVSSTLKKQMIGRYTSQVYQNKTNRIPKGDKSDSNAPKTDICNVRSASFSGTWTYNSLISEGLLSADGSKGLKGFTRRYDYCTATPFLFNPKTKIMINYEDGFSASQKIGYVTEQFLAGVFVFDSTGFNRDGGRHPAVLTTIRYALDVNT
ncbi:BQ2448_3678 [Microbotryum intermedium]|uniref:BQ2448_3678 protein n=1 Tax=Microbotryum intermedium TaxID=269621 RepID=A0A238FIL1_9BASI|nr:BQ2448_3678 [Microbotryum intermedium]